MNRWGWRISGFLVGALAGTTLLSAALGSATAPTSLPPTAEEIGLDSLHSPPLLIDRAESPRLTFEVVCPMTHVSSYACEPTGTLFLRSTGDSEFQAIELDRTPQGTLVGDIDATLLDGTSIEYFADLRDEESGLSITIPAGGRAAPQEAWIVDDWVEVDLAELQLEPTRAIDDVIASAPWGPGDSDLGLSSAKEQSAIGPSSFAVAADGDVVVLDQVNHRLAVYTASNRAMASHIPVDVSGGIADLAIDSDGSFLILDNGGAESRNPVIRRFSADGKLTSITQLGQRTADMISIGPDGPLVHQYPAEMWAPIVGEDGMQPLTAAHQLAHADAARDVAKNVSMVVRMYPDEARFALVSGDAVVRAWRLSAPRGSSYLAEAQLVEPFSDGILAVVRLYDDERAEFRVLTLSPNGREESFSLMPHEWAEASPLSRFRLVDEHLYEMRSDPNGLSIVRYRVGGEA